MLCTYKFILIITFPDQRKQLLKQLPIWNT